MSVLTLKMLEDAAERMVNNFGKVEQVLVSPKAMGSLLAWQKWEKWVSKLPQRKQRQERLRYKLKNRAKHTAVNLPE